MADVPCRWAATCTRPDCKFWHPDKASSEGRGADAATQKPPAGATPCHYGEECTRKDCKFWHPPGRIDPAASAPGGGAPNGQIPCRLGGACSSPDCKFWHADPLVFFDVEEQMKKLRIAGGGCGQSADAP